LLFTSSQNSLKSFSYFVCPNDKFENSNVKKPKNIFIFICYCLLLRGFGEIATNVLALGEEAEFEALNRLPALNLIRSTKLHLSTEAAFLPNAC
jgi:hypothetical protein